tara:strand:+ start:405 stop:2171 length:1767 start_codon:yes stop_codon:yes gene_type:complete
MFKLELKQNVEKSYLELFKSHINFNSGENYNPIYKEVYSTISSNCNTVCFNTKTNIKNILSKTSVNRFIFKDNNDNEKSTFMKYCPLVDPVKYLAGNYNKIDILKLPKYDNDEIDINKEKEQKIQEKINNHNNSAYVDGFFSYISSKLFNNHNFIHGLDFYGSFTCIKDNFNFNITDDLDYLMESEHFVKNINNNYKLLNGVVFEISDTRKNKDKLNISNESIDILTDDITDHSDLFLDDSTDKDSNVKSNESNNDILDITLTSNIKEENVNNCDNTIELTNKSETSESECSDASDTDSDEVSNDNVESCDEDSVNEVTDSEDTDSEDTDSEDEILCEIKQFPTHVVALEDLENTLDHYIENTSNIKNGEWASILFQIVITLCVYQEKINFYHNDLHTSNIMYVRTNKKFLYYCFKGKYYKVPTYGKIYKIIDFGRSIYTLKGHLLFSDSFSKSGDAYSQYNCEPYYNNKKNKIMPNKSFDLVRLGCSLFDYFFEDIKQSQEKLDDIESIINFWCLDDKNKNILYNNNNVDRYPEFKLYKMIARTVHNKVPEEQLLNKIFDKFRLSDKIDNDELMNIDDIPKYSDDSN